MSYAIEAENISKRFRKKILKRDYRSVKTAFLGWLMGRGEEAEREDWLDALRQVSLKVNPGTTLGLVGRNGSGKSTFLKLLAGIYRPDAGTLKTNGRVSALIELGAGFHPEFSGRENVFVNGVILGLSRAEIKKKFDDIVQFAELEDFIDSPVRTYSSGMYMRLGFSIAVNVDPEILLVDEVLAVGDEAFARRCKEKIDDFRNAGKTIVMVTHDLAAVERYCDQAVLVEKGAFLDRGDPRRIIDRYREMIADREEVKFTEKAQHQDRSGDRWGTRDVEIKAIKCYNTEEKEQYIFHSGESVKIEFEYTAHREVPMPVFGVAIYSSDGVHCWGSNTHLDEVELNSQTLKGEGKVAVVLPALNLNHGTFYLEAAVHRPDDFSYDYISWRAKFAAFRIQEERRLVEYGVLSFPRTWEFDGRKVSSRR